MSHIVVLGAGLGGLTAAYELRALMGNKHQVTVVNANEFFQFVPSNPWVAVGWRTREQVTFKIEPYLKRKGINFVPQFVEKQDTNLDKYCWVGRGHGHYPANAAFCRQRIFIRPLP